MYQIVHIGLDTEALRKLDDLRRAYPNLYNRQDILLQVLADAHRQLAENAPRQQAKLAA